jgi:acetyl esterase/lipase
MALLLALRERDIPVPAGAVLMCPWVDLTGRTQRPPQDSPLVFSPETAQLDRTGDLGGSDPWEDQGPWQLSGSIPRSCARAS